MPSEDSYAENDESARGHAGEDLRFRIWYGSLRFFGWPRFDPGQNFCNHLRYANANVAGVRTSLDAGSYHEHVRPDMATIARTNWIARKSLRRLRKCFITRDLRNSHRTDSNRRPAVYKTAALPTELRWRPRPLYRRQLPTQRSVAKSRFFQTIDIGRAAALSW